MNETQLSRIENALRPVIENILHHTHNDGERERLWRNMAAEVQGVAAKVIADHRTGFMKGQAGIRAG